MGNNPHDRERAKRRIASIVRNKMSANSKNQSSKAGDSSMHKLTRISFQKDPFEYELSLGWDEEGLIEGNIEFRLNAKRRHIHGGEIIEVPATVGLYQEDDLSYIGVKLSLPNGEISETIPISDLFEGESKTEQFLESIPALIAGDPLLGCLVRSGLSSTIGTILSCKNKTSSIPWSGRRLLSIGRCLRANISSFVTKFGVRAIKCMVRFGM